MAQILTSKEFRRIVDVRASGSQIGGRIPRVNGAVWYSFNGDGYVVAIRYGTNHEQFSTWESFLAAYEFLDC